MSPVMVGSPVQLANRARVVQLALPGAPGCRMKAAEVALLRAHFNVAFFTRHSVMSCRYRVLTVWHTKFCGVGVFHPLRCARTQSAQPAYPDKYPDMNVIFHAHSASSLQHRGSRRRIRIASRFFRNFDAARSPHPANQSFVFTVTRFSDHRFSALQSRTCTRPAVQCTCRPYRS